MVNLPVDFVFSQGSLQDYSECARRFQLRYLRRLAWPAVQAEPVLEKERLGQMGARFHRMAQQWLSGLPAEKIDPGEADPELAQWWRNLQAEVGRLPGLEAIGQPETGARLFPELTLSAPLANYRLLAKFDLLAVLPDRRLVIYDWKTSARKPKRAVLEKRLQTRVYPYLLVLAGSHIIQAEVQPEQVEMVYWFVSVPEQPERFRYNFQAFQRDGRKLQALVKKIAGLDREAFSKTEDETRCRFCQYRSLCERGVRAGLLDELGEVPEEEDWLEFNLSSVPEIEYD